MYSLLNYLKKRLATTSIRCRGQTIEKWQWCWFFFLKKRTSFSSFSVSFRLPRRPLTRKLEEVFFFFFFWNYLPQKKKKPTIKEHDSARSVIVNNLFFFCSHSFFVLWRFMRSFSSHLLGSIFFLFSFLFFLRSIFWWLGPVQTHLEWHFFFWVVSYCFLPPLFFFSFSGPGRSKKKWPTKI